VGVGRIDCRGAAIDDSPGLRSWADIGHSLVGAEGVALWDELLSTWKVDPPMVRSIRRIGLSEASSPPRRDGLSFSLDVMAERVVHLTIAVDMVRLSGIAEI